MRSMWVTAHVSTEPASVVMRLSSAARKVPATASAWAAPAIAANQFAEAAAEQHGEITATCPEMAVGTGCIPHTAS